MALWIDNTTITLTTNDGIHLLHLRSDIHLTDGSSGIRSAMLLRHITQSTGRRKVGNRITLRLRQDIVSHTDQRIFFAKHLSIFTDKGQTVNIRIHHDTQVILTCLHLIHNTLQVLLQGLRIMSKVTGRLTIQDGICDA